MFNDGYRMRNRDERMRILSQPVEFQNSESLFVKYIITQFTLLLDLKGFLNQGHKSVVTKDFLILESFSLDHSTDEHQPTVLRFQNFSFVTNNKFVSKSLL